MAPNHTSSSATPRVETTPSPSRSEKSQTRRPGAVKSSRTLSNSSIPTLSTTRLARQPSPSTSNAQHMQNSPLPSRRPARSGICPSSSRPALITAAAQDPSQDHHRSDSGRSTGSSRSTATTDSFFLPQHPHTLSRRFKDLPRPPSSSAIVDASKQHARASVLGIDTAIDPAAPSAVLPSAHLFRTKSSVSTTPTSPEEGNGSSLGGPDFPPQQDDDGKLTAQDRVLDDFWRSEYSNAPPSTDPLQSSLPPLMLSDAPIAPSRSQSLEFFAAPLDADRIDKAPEDDLLLQDQGTSIGSATPLVAANLQKLDLQNDDSAVSPIEAYRLSSPVLSSPSGAPTPTKRSDDGRPRISPYQHLVTPASPSSAPIEPKSFPSKSSSSLSSSSAHDHDKTASAHASKRSSTSSSSSFRMTLSRQAKSLRSSFLWTTPTSATTPSPGREQVTNSPALSGTSSSTPASQASSSPSLAGASPHPTTDELSSTDSSSQRNIATQGIAGRRTVSAVTPGKSPARTAYSSSYIPQSRPSEPSSRLDARSKTSPPRTSIGASSASKEPTDYGRSEDRPKSRLSSRLTLHGAQWSMKMSHLTTKKTKDAALSKSAYSQTAVEASSRTVGRHAKSQAAASPAAKASSAPVLNGASQETGKDSSVAQAPKRPGPLPISSPPFNGNQGSSTAAQISPSFAASFAFLNSQIESPMPSPALSTSALPPSSAAPASVEDLAVVKDHFNLVPSANTSAPVDPTIGNSFDTVARAALFDQLADSPEAVYKTLAFPEPATMPASQSLGSVAASSANASRKIGHKKHASLGSTALITKSARAAAADLDKRAVATPVVSSGLPLFKGHLIASSNTSMIAPSFASPKEEGRFFDALTSPFEEQPPGAKTQNGAVLPAYDTAGEFFPSVGTELTSLMHDRAPASGQATSTVPQLSRTSLGRRLSGVFDSTKARATRKNAVASPPQSPRVESTRMDALPTRPETSLGFHLRNPLRRDRKESLKTVRPPPPLPKDDMQRPASTKNGSAASTPRMVSSGSRAEPFSSARKELPRSGTSLGFTTPGRKTSREFSSRITAPTKSSIARSVQPSPASAARPTVRSTSASSPSAATSASISRSPQRPAYPPSSFRSGSSTARLSSYANESPSKTATEASSFLSRRRQPSTEDATASLTSIVNRGTSSQPLQGVTTAPPPSPTEVRRRTTTLDRRVLNPIRTSFAQDPVIVRPATASGFRGPLTAQDRKMSQPTLDMLDDREFLEALEQVRAVQRERIQAQAQEVENKTRLARLGMMSGNHLKTKSPVSMLDGADLSSSSARRSNDSGERQEVDGRVARPAHVPSRPRLPHRRSASADAKLSRSKSAFSTSPESEKALDQRQKDIVKAYADKVSPSLGAPTTGLEWGVGKASGKLHDGTFVNDDDWKKEVKALFLIRELVQTERSYARHLSSLLSVVSKMQVPSNGSSHLLGAKRKSTSNLFAAYSSAYANKTSANSAPPSHVALLKSHLPQLIALSNSLVQRVEENPTSAGVGAAFDVLSAELESTFVSWSSVASQALKDLGKTEQAKTKSPYKIGLVPLMPRESAEVGASTGEALSSSGHSSPGSGFKSSTLRMTSLTRPASPVAVRQEPATIASGQTEQAATSAVSRSTKRRSTITSTSFIPPPRVVVAPPVDTPVVFSSSPEQEKSLESSNSTSSRRFNHSRSQSTLVTPLQTPTSATAPDSWHHPPPGSKSLTPMDIAIMPTQRIPRYGLMLRDLLRNTPPESLSHARVQRAISLIQKVALLCDSAAPVTGVKTAPSSGAATPMRAGSVLGMTPTVEVPLLTAGTFGLTRRA
ncbi:Dbl homology (DH) domain protein [Kalmanozyma brasiliensis GHG001]|uniref:Dbl homology (DH) domain protein n=1 Tax=Kalmanozyma brasiliensis (strain GHG001) TaxID=1365824 RepID=UPI002867DAFB|nr:Dbl homology (DH) domain protein [Kalmanozyma brasiliensis GHG001]EST05174.2 Dbl homology (DH) domain protein [Kalmanozyma brasiliensis GHG001]